MFGKSKEEKEPTGYFYTVYDSKAQTYSEPFPAPNNAILLRDFTNAFKHPEAQEKNRYYMNAEDFSIFKCGQFDVSTGFVVGQTLEHIANCHDLRAMVQPKGIGPT